jgi:hypothetical protein
MSAGRNMSSLRVFVAALAAVLIGVPLAGGATSEQPPPPKIDSAPPNPSGSSSATFRFSDSDQAVTFRCQLDGGGFSPCVSPALYSGLGDGPHTFDVKAVDALLNESELASYTWTVDTAPPPPPSISGPPDPSSSSAATFTFSDDDPTVSFHCRLDANGLPPCSNPTSYSGLDDGAHTLRARAVDPAGNESGVSTYTWTIDTKAPPKPVIESGPANPSGSSSARFMFSDAEAGTSFSCQLDGAPFSPCSSPLDYSGLGDGPHSFAVRAIDAAGNQSSPTAPYKWTIDTVNPVVTLTDKPPLITNQTTASFSFSSSKAGSAYACRLDAGKFASCTSPRVYTGLGDGTHTFFVRATAPGTTSPTTEYTWTVDTVAPSTTITSTPPASSNSATATFAFTSSEQGSTFACSLDAAGFTYCASPQTYAGLGDGTHTFRVQAVDAAGNADTTPATYTWQIVGIGPATVDRTPPGNVRRMKRDVRYHVLKLAWSPPSDADFDHVKIFVSTSPKAPPRKLVYKGAARHYTNGRFKNGLYARYAVLSYDRAGNASRGTAVVVPPSALLRSPRDGAVVKSPPRLLWTRIPKATYYNVQLYSPSTKMLSAWPRRARLAISRSWTYRGRRFVLKRGSYRWFVWPGFGARSKGRYGQLIGQGSFRVR